MQTGEGLSSDPAGSQCTEPKGFFLQNGPECTPPHMREEAPSAEKPWHHTDPENRGCDQNQQRGYCFQVLTAMLGTGRCGPAGLGARACRRPLFMARPPKSSPGGGHRLCKVRRAPSKSCRPDVDPEFTLTRWFWANHLALPNLFPCL